MLPLGVGHQTRRPLDRLSAERERIDGQIATLAHTRDILDDVIVTARRTGRPCARQDDV
jgi:hypothetical protein